jgi:hypothetical protein
VQHISSRLLGGTPEKKSGAGCGSIAGVLWTAGDLPPRLQLLVKQLDKPRSTWLAKLCVLAFIAAVAAASFRFHFVF